MNISGMNSTAKMVAIVSAASGILAGVTAGTVTERKNDRSTTATLALAGGGIAATAASLAIFPQLGYNSRAGLIGVAALGGAGIGAGIAAAIGGVSSIGK